MKRASPFSFCDRNVTNGMREYELGGGERKFMPRLGIFVSHPIQYFAPLWRALAAVPGLEVVVHFFSDHSIRGGG